jgi:glycerol-3-phosphate dehydrogenase
VTSVLSPSARQDALAAATTGTHDVVVVGGGVTGAGAALDAAARGLSVVLLEAGDVAVGTSSRSGKTMHGGLRYLEQLNFSLVFGALRERDLTIKTLAPHLVGHEHFLYPLQHQWEKPYVGAGVGLYDAMATMSKRTGGAPHARYLGRKAVVREAPGLDPEVVIAGLQYPDGRMDDARHTLAVARTAAQYGAHVITHARVTGVRTGADGRASGVTARDVHSGDEFDVSARVVVNAAGVWAAEVQQLAGAHTFTIAPAKGVHLLVRKEAFDSQTGILARAEDSVIILRKWYGHWLLGTTDTPYDGDKSNPTATKEDIDYLLRNVNKLLKRKIGRADLLGTYAGLRPLLAPAGPGSASTTSALSRDHSTMEAPAGMVTIVGGKYTTYRVMARDAVDAAARSMGRELPPTPTAPAGDRVRGARGDPAADAAPLRRRAARRAGADPRRRGAGLPDHRHGGLPARGVPPRGHPRGRADAGRRPDPPHPRGDRGPGRGRRRGRGGRGPAGPAAGLGHRAAEGGGRGVRGAAPAGHGALTLSGGIRRLWGRSQPPGRSRPLGDRIAATPEPGSCEGGGATIRAQA